MNRGFTALAAVVALAAGIYFVAIWETASNFSLTSFDIYQYYYPNMIYAARALAHGGQGLLWNAYQSCGQPFLGISSTGFLYPLNAFFFFFDPAIALRLVTAANLTVAGLSCYFLCRELGTGAPAALCGALAFELGNGMIDLITWGPLVSAPYVWIPAVMLFCERTLRAPTSGNAVGLACSAAVGMLQGFPQITFFTYQLLGLRVLYEIVTRRLRQPVRTLGLLAVALMLPPLLTAVHFFPSVEMAGLGVRGGSLTREEIAGAGFVTWRSMRAAIRRRGELFNPLIMMPFVVAAAGFLRPSTRRPAGFYVGAAALYFALGLGPQTPLFDWYLSLPFSRLFRDPFRFFWLTSFCLAVGAALGVEAVAQNRSADPWWRRLGLAIVLLAALLGFRAIRWQSFFTQEWILGVTVVIAALAAAFMPRRAAIAAVVIAVAVSVNLLGFPYVSNGRVRYPPWVTRLQPMRGMLGFSDSQFDRYGATLETIQRDLVTPQDRIFLVHHHPGFELEPKAAGMHGVRIFQDYEPQPSLRYAEYFVMLRSGIPMINLNHFYTGAGLAPFQLAKWPLINLAASRYFVVDDRMEAPMAVVKSLLPPRTEREGVHVFENRNALPRARYVPRLDVIPDAAVVLRRLAEKQDDPHLVALVENDPANGFLGEPGNQEMGTVEFVTDDPEHVTLRVHAPARGFVVLADQYYPGWQATVDGQPMPIERANYLFRAVEVPAGDSVVEFRFRPLSFTVGAVVSVLTIGGVLVVLLRSWQRRPRPRELAVHSM